jgi:hypothetical protein
MPAPQYWVIYLLEVPNIKKAALAFAKARSVLARSQSYCRPEVVTTRFVKVV